MKTRINATILVALISAPVSSSLHAENCHLLARISTPGETLRLPLNTQILRCGSPGDIDVIVEMRPRISLKLEGPELQQFYSTLHLAEKESTQLSKTREERTSACIHPVSIELGGKRFTACPGTPKHLLASKIYDLAISLLQRR